MRRILTAVSSAAVLAATLTACGGLANLGSLAELPGPATTNSAPPTETTDPIVEEDTFAPDTNERGNMEIELGEPQSLVDVETETDSLTFTFTDLTVGAQCTEPYAEPPELGTFLALDVTVQTAREADPYTLSGMMYPEDFTVFGSDGVTVGGLGSVATYGCIPESRALPMELTPGSTYKGTVLLDVPEPSGTLIYRPSFMQDGGWELNY